MGADLESLSNFPLLKTATVSKLECSNCLDQLLRPGLNYRSQPLIFAEFTTWCLVALSIRVMFSITQSYSGKAKKLLYASPSKLGFCHLARLTSLCYGEEKNNPSKSPTRWDKKWGEFKKTFHSVFLALGSVVFSETTVCLD